MDAISRLVYRQYRRNLHRPERPARPRPDILAWALEHRSRKP